VVPMCAMTGGAVLPAPCSHPKHDPGPRGEAFKAKAGPVPPRPVTQAKSSSRFRSRQCLRQILAESREPDRPESAETHMISAGWWANAYVIHC